MNLGFSLIYSTLSQDKRLGDYMLTQKKSLVFSSPYLIYLLVLLVKARQNCVPGGLSFLKPGVYSQSDCIELKRGYGG